LPATKHILIAFYILVLESSLFAGWPFIVLGWVFFGDGFVTRHSKNCITAVTAWWWRCRSIVFVMPID